MTKLKISNNGVLDEEKMSLRLCIKQKLTNFSRFIDTASVENSLNQMAIKSEETISFLNELPRTDWRPDTPLLQYKGFWLFPWTIESLHSIETQYKPLPSDVILASFPKSGTTWLKAITFSILNHRNPDDLLQKHNPHQLVPFLELKTVGEDPDQKYVEIDSSSRIFNTHLPYSILPENIKNSTCKMIYISRDPADVIVSGWNLYNKPNISSKAITLEECFDEMTHGTTIAGPLFDHVLEYWNARDKENMLFVTYEELKTYPNENVKRIAEFLGCSLSDDEVEEVVMRSSFERLSKLDIKTGEMGLNVTGANLKYNTFFRKGRVGDGKKHVTTEMKRRLNDIVNEKWGGSGLESKLLLVVDPQVSKK